MSRHRTAREPRRWLPHALAGSASAAGIAFVVLFGEWSSSGPLVQVFEPAPATTVPSTSSCVPTTSTTAEGRTWHGCWPTYATPLTTPPRPTTTTARRPTPSSTTEQTPGPAVLPNADPFVEEH